MRYKILSKITAFEAGGLALIAQPVTDRGAVARGGIDVWVPPGLLCAALRQAMVEGEVWELQLADDRQTLIGASYRGEERTA